MVYFFQHFKYFAHCLLYMISEEKFHMILTLISLKVSLFPLYIFSLSQLFYNLNMILYTHTQIHAHTEREREIYFNILKNKNFLMHLQGLITSKSVEQAGGWTLRQKLMFHCLTLISHFYCSLENSCFVGHLSLCS